MKKSLCIILALFVLFNLAQAQTEQTSNRRTFWLGVNADFGAFNLHMGDGLLDGIYGVTLNSAVSINNTFAVGPYLSMDIFNADPAPFGGVLAKMTFPNNSAIFAGYGLGVIELDFWGKHVLCHQFRVGLKFRRSFFLSGSYMRGEYNGAAIGLGFSFGGKPRKK